MKKRILIVEDNELNRAMLCEILSDKYQVLEAENGQIALEILHQYADSISLVLLDVMMPVMDGYTCLDRIMDDAELSLIPVIVLTQGDSESDEVTALEHGATDFVPKPYRPKVLLHRIASIIKLRETAAMINQLKYDRLTGLYDKDYFYQKVRERLLDDPDGDYCIICSNIENFKLFNDVFGTQEGDSLLKYLAYSARNIVKNLGFCARFGSDRFLCFLKQEKKEHDKSFFERLRYSNLDALPKNVVLRWGIYQITDRSIPVEQMCDRAMLAVDSIKGRYNRFFAVYDDSLRNNLLREQTITDAMSTALSEGQFVVYYQPKYSLNDNRMVGAEALVRWIHPEWGFMSPGEFIPLFEKNRFISRLDRYILESVCAQLREWQDKGHPVLPVSVNISRADIFVGDLEDTLLHLVEKYRIDPANLHLEITESAYVENLDKVANTIEKLRKQGFILEMDDFGNGYSSLSMLSKMKLDIVKLDMKFMWNETAKPANQSILGDIIGAAHRMHMSVVAEGVENKDQVRRLIASGCDYVQGYYFAKPMPAAEFEKLLKAHTARQLARLPEQAQEITDIRKLLLVDESASYKEQVCRLFEGRYQILDASNAQDAIEYLKNYGDGDISAVILSATLPCNGAEEFLKVMRSDPTFWNIPLISTIPNGDMAHELPSEITTGDFLCKCHPLFDLRRRVEHLIELSEFHKREMILKDEACRDYLTGLLNRRGLKAAFASLRKNDMPLAVVLFDLDNLKKLNDSFGHNTGDSIIRSFADLVRRQTRADDIQCRYGGDEFLVILKNLPNEMTALKKAEEICRIFRNDFSTDEFSTGCSGGIAWCGLDENISSALIERADQALYCAKHKEKGRCCLWKE